MATTPEERMIGRLNHVAIAVPDLEAAAAQYRDTLGAKVGAPQDEPDHGVTVIFIELPNTKIELLYPLGDGSPIAGFLEKNPSGGIHHICYEVDDILAARDRLKAQGARVLGTGEPKIGAIVLFAVIWFMVFFIALQIRPKSQADAGEVVPGTPASAPVEVQMKRKVVATTMIAIILWSVIASVILSGAVTLRDIDWFGKLGSEAGESQ
jgi:methylmalonyl-CoA/ethylmalonyl-CoA epimerase